MLAELKEKGIAVNLFQLKEHSYLFSSPPWRALCF